MASQAAKQLSKRIQERFGVKVAFADLIDAELQEVREVLDLCDAVLSASEPHVPTDLAIAISERRKRARALYERLKVD